MGRNGDIRGLLDVGTDSPLLPCGDVVLGKGAPGIGRLPCHGEDRPDKNPLSLQTELPGDVSLECRPKEGALLLLLSQPDIDKTPENGVGGEVGDERS